MIGFSRAASILASTVSGVIHALLCAKSSSRLKKYKNSQIKPIAKHVMLLNAERIAQQAKQVMIELTRTVILKHSHGHQRQVMAPLPIECIIYRADLIA